MGVPDPTKPSDSFLWHSTESCAVAIAGMSLLNAKPRVNGVGSPSSNRSGAASSPLAQSSVGLAGYKPSRASVERRTSGERKRGSFDSAHQAAAARSSLHMMSNRGSTEPRTGSSQPSSDMATHGSMEEDRHAPAAPRVLPKSGTCCVPAIHYCVTVRCLQPSYSHVDGGSGRFPEDAANCFTGKAIL